MEQKKDLTRPKIVSKEDSRAEIEKNLKLMYETDKQMVRGIFKYYEVPGGFLDFVYKKYKWDKLEKYSFRDNEIYTIPLGVAKHINTNIKYPVHEYQTDENGKSIAVVGRKVSRAGFQSLEFQDFTDMNASKEILVARSL